MLILSTVPLSIVLKGVWRNHLPHFDEYMTKFRNHSRNLEKQAKTAHMLESARSREIQLRSHALQLRNETVKRRDQALSSLPTVNYLSKQSKQDSLKHPGTCSWLHNSPQVQAWMVRLTSDCLSCYGIPGSGKSVLAASLCNLLSAQVSSSDSQIVCYYYCDYSDNPSLDAAYVVASLIKQVLVRLPLDCFNDKFECPFRDSHPLPTLLVATDYLIGKLKEYRTVYLIIDGLDELDSRNQGNVLKLITQILQRTEFVAKVFITSRTEELQVKNALQSYGAIRLSETHVNKDITLYIKDQIEQLEAPHPLLSDIALKENVIQALTDGAKGM